MKAAERLYTAQVEAVGDVIMIMGTLGSLKPRKGWMGKTYIK